MKKKQEEPRRQTIVQNCDFAGVRWDKPALEVLGIVAKSLFNLTELFKKQNVNVPTLLNAQGDDVLINGCVAQNNEGNGYTIKSNPKT